MKNSTDCVRKSLETECENLKVELKNAKAGRNLLSDLNKIRSEIVDCKRYNTDEDYRENIVLKSNGLDARACYDLGIIIQEDFKKAFATTKDEVKKMMRDAGFKDDDAKYLLEYNHTQKMLDTMCELMKSHTLKGMDYDSIVIAIMFGVQMCYINDILNKL